MTAVASLVRRRAWAAGAAVAVALGAGGCGTSPAGGTASHTVRIAAQSLPRVGTVLVTAAGNALYMFVPDDQRKVTCVGLCAETWPPVRLRSGGKLAAGPGTRRALLGSDADPAGGRVVTYDGWPLYTYTGDVYKGQTTGQAIDRNGGYWYLIRPSGQLVKTRLH
jgi:predicted lipoprotein with Yx(FWY)xxD motif